jgi:hypothetical protein
MKFQNLVGQKFGNAIVLKRVANKGGRVAYLCKCDCGNEFVTTALNLKSGDTKSCGCIRAKMLSSRNERHGKSKTRLYRIWLGIKKRCTNKNESCYKNYGGRGIKICDEWVNNYPAFETWANANGYNENLTIDRIDVNGNYCPNNCRWITKQEQGYNKRNSRFIEYNNKKRTVAEWAKELGINYDTIHLRLQRGWPIEKVLSRENYHGMKITEN